MECDIRSKSLDWGIRLPSNIRLADKIDRLVSAYGCERCSSREGQGAECALFSSPSMYRCQDRETLIVEY